MVAVKKKSAKATEAEDGEIFSASSFSSLGLHSNLCDQLQGKPQFFDSENFNLYFEEFEFDFGDFRFREVGLQRSDFGSGPGDPGDSLRPPRVGERGDGDGEDGGVSGSGCAPPELAAASGSALRWDICVGTCADERAVSAGL